MRRAVAMCVWLLVAGCSSAPAAARSPEPSPSAEASRTGGAVPMAGGCGETQVYQGGEPDWLTRAGDDNNPTFLPYFVTSPANAAGFLFSYPLRSGAPSNPGNKILWVVGVPRDGNHLVVDGHPLNARTPAVHMSFEDNAGPGEIYPSEVDVPSPGCWHFDVSWGPNHTSVDLVFA